MSNLEALPFPNAATSTHSIEVEYATQQVIDLLSPTAGKPITYDEIEGKLRTVGLDPYEYPDCYQIIIEQLEALGALVVDSPSTPPEIDAEMQALLEADEVEQLLKSIMTEHSSRHKTLLTAEEERRLLEIYADGQRASRELPCAQSDLQIHQLERRIRAGKFAYDELIERNLRLVAANVLKYGRGARQLDFEDLLQEGSIGLSRAIKGFNLDLNMRMSTYATWWIRQAISRAVADQDRTIRIPVHMLEQISRMNRVERELELKLGRAPTHAEIVLGLDFFSPNESTLIRDCWRIKRAVPAELVTRLNKAIDRVQKLKVIAASEPLSTDAAVGKESNETLGDFIPASGQDEPEVNAMRRALRDCLAEIMYEIFPERTRAVLEKRFGFNGNDPHTLEQIGQLYHLTRERVRQLEFSALRRLRHPKYARKVRDFLEH